MERRYKSNIRLFKDYICDLNNFQMFKTEVRLSPVEFICLCVYNPFYLYNIRFSDVINLIELLNQLLVSICSYNEYTVATKPNSYYEQNRNL